MPIPKFTNEQTTKFISLYKVHPCLWQSDTRAYRNKTERKKAIEAIVAEMNITDFKFTDCLIKIKNVRSHYLQELKKIYDSNSRGVRKGEEYTPTLSWFNLIDSFLWNYVMHQSPKLLTLKRSRMSQHDGILMDPNDDIKKEEMEFDDGEHSVRSWNVDTIHHDDDDFAAACNPMLYDDSETFDPQPSISKKICTTENGNYTPQVETTTRQSNDIESEFDIFGRGVAAQLKSIPIIEAVQLQLKIQQSITEHRLRIFMNALPTAEEGKQ